MPFALRAENNLACRADLQCRPIYIRLRSWALVPDLEKLFFETFTSQRGVVSSAQFPNKHYERSIAGTDTLTRWSHTR